ncbi:MAG: hypothetical protein ACFFD4_25600, partial [Candidatus Odinarchaeota archaeon]
LWYYSYNPSTGETTSVYPTDMIIHATVCYGYAKDSSSTPFMAQAFVDNGAAAFVGATVIVPVAYNDDFTSEFWWCLCQGNLVVYTATIAYIMEHNDYYLSTTWQYNTDIKIYGDDDAVLQN